MALVKYQFRPGINKELTSYANEGGWTDSDKIRFRFGKPEKIGGWDQLGEDKLTGAARALHDRGEGLQVHQDHREQDL